MKRLLFIILNLSFSAALLLSCGTDRSNGGNDSADSKTKAVRGADVDQPIMDGWTFQQAAEFWLASVLADERNAVVNGEGQLLSPEELAQLTKGHVQVKLPIQPSDAMPRFDIDYKQPQAGGTITFHEGDISEVTYTGDTLSAIGTISYELHDDLYFPDATNASDTVFVQSRGRGLFTAYAMRRVRDRKHETDDSGAKWLPRRSAEWQGFIISVFPGGDSLVVSRGMNPIETFYANH